MQCSSSFLNEKNKKQEDTTLKTLIINISWF